jgi:pimeloyl-ACP methyl ester carboxylesterase
LRKAGLATLLIDLLTSDEEADDVFSGKWRFDISLLARRLTGITDWVHTAQDTRDLNLGLFGASTGAAAALITAAQRDKVVKALVSRGGRPDLALPSLDRVKAPTLLIVGGNDFPVIEMNREALARIKTEKRLVIVPGATHLFEEPGALERVASLAKEWFIRYLAAKNKTKNTEIVR